MGSLKRLFIGLLSAIVLMPGLVQAGTGRQMTTFLVDANERGCVPLDRAERDRPR